MRLSENETIALIGGVPLILAQIANIITALRNGKKIDANTVIQKQTHLLVNSQMGAQKKLTAIAARALASAMPTPENNQAAADAEKLFADHEHRQLIVDTQIKLDNLQKDS